MDNNILEQKERFDYIVKKYNLNDKQKSEEISKFLTTGKKISYIEFAVLFVMTQNDAKDFLEFILKGIDFKENYIDKKE